ncbi:uncharacterized protein [Choristoneura fumiferana]|uniref:uncharacterized protein n=1 Tax=Choristoneura fumiferana TaxID=7141 RepID=UPI003D157EEB
MDTKALTKSMDELAQMFHARMNEFEANLSNADSKDYTLSSVAADFMGFKSFVLKALECLQVQVKSLAGQVDQLEQRSRRKMVLVHGISEADAEDTTVLAVEVFKDRIKCDVSVEDISRSFRAGRSQRGKARPILIAFRDVVVRDRIWYSKTALKGSGITLSEFLTLPRHETFKAARERFGMRDSWTRDGVVMVRGGDGELHRVASVAELDKIAVPAKASGGDAVFPGRQQRPKRAARKENK